MGRSTPSMMKRKHLLEALRAQAGERLEHAAVAGNLGVADHWGFLCWSCLPSVAQVVLLPIVSNFYFPFVEDEIHCLVFLLNIASTQYVDQ